MKHRIPVQPFLLLLALILAVGGLALSCGDDDDDANDGGAPTATEEPGDDEPTPTSEVEPTATPEAEATAEPAETPDSGGGGDGGPAQVLISAENIAFSTGRIELQAGVSTEVVFTNNDAAIPHNLHIIAGDVDEATPTFTGDDGPSMALTIVIDEPGNYMFQCDVHPGTMSGVVVVE